MSLPIEQIMSAFIENRTNCKLKSPISPSNQSLIIDQCDYLRRLVFALHFYQENRDKTSKHSLSSFMTDTYPITRFIDDIKHYKTQHANDNQLLHQLQQQLSSSDVDLKFDECSLEKCKYSLRHFSRDNKDEDKTEYESDRDDLLSLYSLKLDNLHFNLCHLFDSGFRYKFETNNQQTITSSDQEDDIDVDKEYLQVLRFIMDKREAFNRFKTTTNKYNIKMTSTETNKDETFRDLLFNEIENEKIVSFIIEQQFESESIRDDFEDILFCGNDDIQRFKQSNFYQFSDYDQSQSFQKMLNLIRKYKCYVVIYNQ